MNLEWPERWPLIHRRYDLSLFQIETFPSLAFIFLRFTQTKDTAPEITQRDVIGSDACTISLKQTEVGSFLLTTVRYLGDSKRLKNDRKMEEIE